MSGKNPTRALSIRQPYAEQIMVGKKRFEYRSIRTNILERVYIYASKTRTSVSEWESSGYEEGSLPIGVIVGTVEVTACHQRKHGFAWRLENPVRSKRKLKPRNQPQPVWFKPF